MKLIVFLSTIIFSLIFPTFVFAHGGFEKRAGNITIYINQTPVSPLVGETVNIYATFKDEGRKITKSLSDKNLTNWPVELTLIDTYYGNELKDKVVYKKGLKTDINGGIDFTYTFNKENYFDIEFALKDSKGNLQNAGFLIQPRNSISSAYFVIAFIAGMISLFLLKSNVLKFFKKIITVSWRTQH